jgi:hypothetical protein
MITDKNTSFHEKLSKIVSVIFHPLLIPLYGLLIIFFAPTMFWYLPLKVKEILFLVVVVNNVLIPFLLMPLFRYNNIISAWTIESRKERILPLLSVSLLYSITAYILYRFQIPMFVKSFALAISFIALTVTIINFWWKISLYSTGAGALTGIVVTLSLKMNIPLFWFLIPVIILSGLILSSRLKLNFHNSAQVYVGYLTGLLGLNLFMLYF